MMTDSRDDDRMTRRTLSAAMICGILGCLCRGGWRLGMFLCSTGYSRPLAA